MADSFLILTRAQAEAVDGPTATGAALRPLALADGTRFVLPVAVLADPAHQQRHAELSRLPVAQVPPEDFLATTLSPT